MRKMKETGLSWLKEIPEDWQISKIKYVATLSPSCDRSELTAESVITYTPMEYIKNGAFINNTEQYGNVPASLTPYQEGDIAMAKVTPCFENGNIAVMEGLANGFGLGSSELIIFRPENIETRFLFYWLRNIAFVERAISTITGTGGLKRISTEFVRNSEIPLPKVDEQKKIAIYLDKKCNQLDSIIDRQNQVIEKLKSYKIAMITEITTKGLNPKVRFSECGNNLIGEIPSSWKLVRLKNVYQKVKNPVKVGPFGSQLTTNDYTPDGCWVYNQRVILDNNFESNDTYISLEKYHSMIGFAVEANDILVTTRGTGTTGHLAKVPENFKEGILHPCVMRIKLDESVCLYEWLSYIFEFTAYLREQIDIASNTSSLPVLYSNTLSNLCFPLPSLGEQKEIINYLDKKCVAIDSNIAKRRQLIDKLTEYKKSLIFEVVTGKKEV